MPHFKSWYEEDEARVKAPKKYVSYTPKIDNAIMAMERWLAHPLKHKFLTLQDFISWSMSSEDQPFKKGGLFLLII